MLAPEKKAIFDQFSKCEMGWHRAVRTGKFENYSVFLDEYFAAGYKYPIPNEDMLQKDAMAFDSFIKAAAEHDRRSDAEEAEENQRGKYPSPPCDCIKNISCQKRNNILHLLKNQSSTLLIADAGPFNTLAAIDGLELFQKINIPIAMTDAVFLEITGKSGLPDKDGKIRSFILQNDIMEIKTVYGLEMLRMIGKQQSFDDQNFGERSLADVVLSGRLEKMASKGPYLILFEDLGGIRQVSTENTYMLSTVGFLRGLEDCGIIPDAELLIQKAVRHGRKFSDYPDDTD